MSSKNPVASISLHIDYVFIIFVFMKDRKSRSTRLKNCLQKPTGPRDQEKVFCQICIESNYSSHRMQFNFCETQRDSLDWLSEKQTKSGTKSWRKAKDSTIWYNLLDNYSNHVIQLFLLILDLVNKTTSNTIQCLSCVRDVGRRGLEESWSKGVGEELDKRGTSSVRHTVTVVLWLRIGVRQQLRYVNPPVL